MFFWLKEERRLEGAKEERMDGAEEGLESDFRNFEANLPVEMLGPRPLDS